MNDYDDNPPAFNLPAVIVVLCALMFGIHILRTYVFDDQTNLTTLIRFAFVPAFYSLENVAGAVAASRFWSPVTHGLLHGDWTHILVNMLWFIAFGSAVARRFGTSRFLIFLAIATAAGAGMHYLFYPQSNNPLIGASGAVSACMGAAIRFAFGPGRFGEDAVARPALSLVQSLANRGVMTFVIIWFALNFLFGANIIPLGVEANIAWEAHMGGFLFGWLGFALFDSKRV